MRVLSSVNRDGFTQGGHWASVEEAADFVIAGEAGEQDDAVDFPLKVEGGIREGFGCV